jgi:hypothetical protein
MRGYQWTLVLCGTLVPCASGDEGKQFVQRTPAPIHPYVQTMDRAGNPNTLANHTLPSVTRFDAVGYVGGARLLGNGPKARGGEPATGPIHDGVFGSDFGGFFGHTGRVFLAPSADPSRGPVLAHAYRTETPNLPTPATVRPLKRAILKKREEKEGGGEH